MNLLVALAVGSLISIGHITSDTLTVIAERTVWCGPEWTATFTDTKAIQDVNDTCVRPGRYSREYILDVSFWRRLEAEIVAADFATLPRRIQHKPDSRDKMVIVLDDDVLCITLRRNAVEQRYVGPRPISR